MSWLGELLGATAHWWGKSQRSGRWPALRDKFIRHNPYCAACGRTESLEAHHVVPFQEDRQLELVESNLISLCRTCHFVFGHLGDWASWNTDVRADAAQYMEKRRRRPPHDTPAGPAANPGA